MIVPTLQEQRAQVLEAMAGIDQMIRGHVSVQSYKVKRRGQTVVQGPYYLLQRHEDGRNLCQRISDPEVQQITDHVLAFKRYQELAERYAALTEQLTWNQQDPNIKKKFRRFWQPTSPRRRPS